MSSDGAKSKNNAELSQRIKAAELVGQKFSRAEISDADREVAGEIFKIMVADAEISVREALSASIKDNPNVPHDIAKTLANDVAEVSLPILEFSEVLTDEDLIEIITHQDSISQKAIARRETVSSDVVETIVDNTADETVVAEVMKNDGADIAENVMSKVLDTYGESEIVNVPISERKNISVSVAERLVALVSEKVKEHLVTHHEMNPDIVTDLFFDARERATNSLTGEETKVKALVEDLHNNGRLTESLIFRALCMGDTDFFDAALAKRAGIPASNAFKLINDKGDSGLKSLFKAGNLSLKMLPIVSVALMVIEDMQTSAGEDRQRFKTRLLERILTECELEIDDDTLEYFMDKIAVEDDHEAA
jgi:uncharacterized protein (DUF2336 family)